MSKIIEKIEKLLALANSDNEHEAKLAAQRAMEIMTKNNIRMQEMPVGRDYTNDQEEFNKMSTEDCYINTILVTHFFVQMVTERKRKEKKTVVRMYGTETNLEVARYIQQYLRHTFKRLWLEYKAENPVAKRLDYYAGLKTGLNQQLHAARKVVENEVGLMVVRDGALDQFIIDNEGKLGKRRMPGAVDRGTAAFNSGFQTGERMTIRKAVNSGPVGGGLRLLKGGK